MTNIVHTQRIIAMILACPIDEWVTTKDVHKHLTDIGYKIHLRSVERDLLSVADRFAITVGRDSLGRARWWMRCRALEVA